MGNCHYKPIKTPEAPAKSAAEILTTPPPKPKKSKSTAEIVPHDHAASTMVRLYGSPISLHTAYVRFALRHKGVPVKFTPSISDFPLIEIGSERVSGSRDSLIEYLEARFPQAPLKRHVGAADEKPWVVSLTTLQHRSMTWHVERLVRWSEELSARGGGKRRSAGIDPSVGTPKMEVKKFSRSYSKLLELMLEHAQMEEKILFPILNSADPGICKAANEEHGRHLPIMNGIKEDIKSVGVMDTGSLNYHEAFANLSKRLRALLEHCKEHFVEEEIQVLPYIEATELSKPRQGKVLEQSLDSMQATHSRLFNFFLEGLLPVDAMHYLDLVATCHDEERLSSMLQKIDE